MSTSDANRVLGRPKKQTVSWEELLADAERIKDALAKKSKT